MKKTIMISGSSRGIGKNLAITFAERGYNLILHGRDEKALEDVIKECKTDCEVVLGDIRDLDTIDRLYTISKKRNINILVNNAGIYSNRDFKQESFQDFLEVLDVNLISPVRLIKTIYPIFKRKQEGLIVNINSLAGLKGNPSECSYCASKFGLRGFSSSLREYAIRDGIVVTDVFLGAMNTRMTRRREDQARCIDPKEAAEVIANLCENYKTLKVDEVVLTRRLK